MKNFLLEVFLPRTDAGVAVQWAVMVPIWLISVWLVRRRPIEIKQFVWGLAILNLGWFMARMAH